MQYKQFGETFKKIRQQCNIPLSQFSSIGIPKTTLSDFESGKSMMAFDKVCAALQFLGYSLEEYENALNNYTFNEHVDILLPAAQAVLDEDQNSLTKAFVISQTFETPYINLRIKALLGKATNEELQTVIEFLNEVEIWTYKELCIFYILIDYVKVNDLIKLLMKLKTSGAPLYSSKYKEHIYQLLCRATTTLSYLGYQKVALDTINEIKSRDIAQTMFLKNLLNGTKDFGYTVSKVNQRENQW